MRPPPLEHNTSGYERPNQPWVCGSAADGHACAASPTARGGCPALAECRPLRDGDRWLCNRADIRGGACEPGPTPDGACGCVPHCTPVRSLRAKRGRFVVACALATAAALVLMLSADWRNEIIAPGPLAGPHAQLLRREGQPPNCAACHPAAEDGLAAWTTSLVAGHGDGPTQSQLCMKCHEKTIAPEFSLAAHNVPAGVLKRGIEEWGIGTNPTNPSPQSPAPSPQSVACAVCHREHHGASFDLTAVDNAACQACHQHRYKGFATEHPDFNNWPYAAKTQIIFNHASHVAKHFLEKNQSFDCRKCHGEDRTTATQRTASYEVACAACHDEKIATSVARGAPMFVLPTLDLDALRAAGHELGPWPKGATGDFDGRLPPVMKLLLAADPAAAQAMARLGANFEFLDIDADDKNELAACAELATAIKKLLAELSETGLTAAGKRLSTALGHEISEQEARQLFAGLSNDTLQPAARAWLGKTVNAERQEFNAPPPSPGTWFYDAATMSIRYQPSGHADPVATGWLTLLAATPGVGQNSVAKAALKELATPTAPGLCASCHSIEAGNTGQLAIHWRSYDGSTAQQSLTKFRHGPHLLLRELADCTSCHAIDEKADPSKSYADWNSHVFVSEFKPLAKQDCATCHTATASGDACQKCHNYHVGAGRSPAPTAISAGPFERTHFKN